MKEILAEELLVPEQKVAVQKLRKFLDGSERVFVLSGKAGTGKTTVIGVAFKDMILEDMGVIEHNKSDYKKTYNLIGVAMAHKAKNNLREKGNIPYVNTFASTYGHKEVHDQRTGARRFVPDQKKIKFADCRKPFRVFIVDEVSMFNKKMMDLVMKQTSMFAKIVFLGDRGQLPPILEDSDFDRGQDSPVWDMELPEYCRHDLTERVRQTDSNPIVEMSDVIYDEIFKERIDLMGVLNYIKTDRLLDNGQGFMNIEENDVYQMFRSSSEDYLDTKIIAYTNRTVNSFNRFMRNYVHNTPKEQFINDEIIYMNSTFYSKDTNGDDFAFYNSSEYLIKDTNYGEIDSIEVMYAELEDSKWMPIVLGGKGHQNYESYRERLLEYSNAKQWKEYWNFRDKFGDFSYGYTLTAYKAQGSTYKNVYISLADILGLTMLSDKRKLQTLYTAITRASHNVYFLNN